MIRTILVSLALLALALPATCQELYIKAFGNPAFPALIFLHGGPGYNSATFEATTPQRLADSGFFVVVYDRRGEGRSRDPMAKFSFRESIEDLDSIYRRFALKQASLLGHSFGGVVATRFAQAHPEKVKALVLVSAPPSFQASFRNIIARSRAIYQERSDSVQLGYMTALEAMDTTSMMYSTYCLGHAMQNGFYAPKERSAEAQEIYGRLRADTALSALARQMDFKATKGFWTNEHYTTLDIRPALAELRRKGTAIYGVYGKEDGLYSQEQVAELGRIIGSGRLRYLERCSHNVFIDQQTQFISTLADWLR